MTVEYRPAPCATCPFRRQTKKALWHRSEFERLAERDAEPFGAQFGCHEDGKKVPAERGPCVGWLLDQKRRGVPSLSLRIHLTVNPTACKHFNSIGDAGPELYSSMEEMFAANKKADDALRAMARREGTRIVAAEKPKKKRRALR